MKMTNNTEKNLYKKDSHLYDLDNREIMKIDIPFYLEYASRSKGDILELGCGTGRVTIPLAEAGYEIWGIELSDTMIEQFKSKIKNLPQKTAERIHLIKGDMSNFTIDRKFPLIIIPIRSFQILNDENLENTCLHSIYNHMTDEGYFILDIGNFNKIKENSGGNNDEVFDWENTDPKTGNRVSRYHIIERIDKEKQVVFIKKIYRITKQDGSIEKIDKHIQWKYFYEDQAKKLLTYNGFNIVKEMGSYNGSPLNEGTEFIFVCQKK